MIKLLRKLLNQSIPNELIDLAPPEEVFEEIIDKKNVLKGKTIL